MKKITALLIAVAAFAATVTAQNIPDKPTPPRLVNDFASVISPDVARALEDSLASFAKHTSTQITVVTVASLDGTSPADYATQLGQKWGVGTKGNNNGVVILVKPKIGNEKGQAFISTGYGLEGALPDVLCSRIVRDKMIPYFQKNDYSNGIAAGAITVMKAAQGEYTATEESEEDDALFVCLVVVSISILILLVLCIAAAVNNNHRISSTDILTGAMLGQMFNQASRSNWDSFNSGSGSFGGFGGFGGGSFGGGGGGGSW